MARAKAAVTTIKRGLKHLLRPAVRDALLPVIVACVLAASQARHRCWLILNTFLLHRLRNGEDLPDIAGGDADEDEDGAEDRSSYASPLFTLVRQVLMLGHPKAHPIQAVPGLHDWYANTFLPAHGDQGPLAFREDPMDQISKVSPAPLPRADCMQRPVVCNCRAATLPFPPHLPTPPTPVRIYSSTTARPTSTPPASGAS